MYYNFHSLWFIRYFFQLYIEFTHLSGYVRYVKCLLVLIDICVYLSYIVLLMITESIASLAPFPHKISHTVVGLHFIRISPTFSCLFEFLLISLCCIMVRVIMYGIKIAKENKKSG